MKPGRPALKVFLAVAAARDKAQAELEVLTASNDLRAARIRELTEQLAATEREGAALKERLGEVQTQLSDMRALLGLSTPRPIYALKELRSVIDSKVSQ